MKLGKIKKVLNFGLFFLASLPKTVYFNLASLPLKQAVRLPIIVGYNMRILETHRGIIEFSDKVKRIRPGMVRFGFGGTKGIVANRYGVICLERGKLVLDGTMTMGEGASIRVNGILRVGNHFSANKNCFVSCSAQGSVIGDDVMLGWNASIRDSDGHTVYHKGEPKQSQRPFTIGDHVWVCAEAHILKGVTLGKNSVAAYRSTVTRSFPEEGSLVGGTPATLIQQDINWGAFIGE